MAGSAIGAVETEPIARKGAAGCVLQAEIEKAVSQTVKVQLLTGSTTARSSAVSCGCRPPLDSGGRSAIILIKLAP